MGLLLHTNLNTSNLKWKQKKRIVVYLLLSPPIRPRQILRYKDGPLTEKNKIF